MKIVKFLPLLTLVLGFGFGFWLGRSWPLFEREAPAASGGPGISRVELTYEAAAWLVWWDQDNGLKTLRDNAVLISSVKPFWYQVSEDGAIEKYSGAEDEGIINFAKENGIGIIPAVSNNHQPELVEPIISSKNRTQEHIQNIVNLLRAKGYDGIEIDYESLKAGDRNQFSSFMQDLAEAIHAEGKLLTVALHAKTAEPGTWDGPKAQDWKALGDACDRVKVMTYDYHWSTSEAGAIAPLSWVEDVAKFAVSKISKKKVYLGVPFYGYDWVGKQGEGVTWEDARELITRYKASPKRDPASKELYFSYKKDGQKHEVWFNDAASLKAKLKLVKRYELAGIGIWRIGREDPEVWSTIQSDLK